MKSNALFTFVTRAFFPGGAPNEVYVPLTTNQLQSLQGAGTPYMASPQIVSAQTGFNPYARQATGIVLGNQVAGTVTTQGLIQNRPGYNF